MNNFLESLQQMWGLCSLSWMVSLLWAVQFCSVAQSCPMFCDPMECSTSGFPVHHQLPEFIQTHVHRLGDDIHYLLLCCPLLPSSTILPSIWVFSMDQFFAPGGQNIRISASASVFPVNIQDWFLLDGLLETPYSPRDFQESSLTPQFKSINSSMLSFIVQLSSHTWLLEKP